MESKKTVTRKPLVNPVQIAKKATTTATLFLRIAIGFVAAALLLGGSVALWKLVLEPLQPMAQVKLLDGTTQKISTAEFVGRVHYEQMFYLQNKEKADADAKKEADANFGQPPKQSDKPGADANTAAPTALGFAAVVLDRMTQEILMQEEASRRGLKVGEDEVDTYIGRNYGYIAAEGAPAPTTPQNLLPLKSNLGRDLKQMAGFGISEADFRQIMRLQLLEKKLGDSFVAGIPIRQDRVTLKLIRFDVEDQARKLTSANWTGPAFDALYRQALAGKVPSAVATVLDWSSQAELNRDFNAVFGTASFQLKPGDIFPTPVSAVNGWYLARAVGHEVRDNAEDWRKARGHDAFLDWLEGQQKRVVQFPVWMERVPELPKPKPSQ